MTKEKVYCWICGEEANSREHKIKRSDIKQIIGEATQAKPLYVHDKNTSNKKVQSTNAKFFKGEKDLCAKCNNELTQPHDISWETLSHYLHKNWDSISKKGEFRMTKAFPSKTSLGMKGVHLYFAKLLGCALKEAKASIPTDSLAEGILNSKPVPNLWLSLGKTPDDDYIETVGRTDLVITKDTKTDKEVAATQLYTYGEFSVLIEYSVTTDIVYDLPENWHPIRGAKLFRLSDLKNDNKSA